MQDSNIEINTSYSELNDINDINNKNKFYKNIIINILVYVLYLIISIIIFSFTINIIKNDYNPIIIILGFYLAIIIINLISIFIFALLIYLGYIIDDDELTFNIGRTGVFFIIPQFFIRFLGFIIPIILFVFIGLNFSNIISESILLGFIITDILIIILDCIITVLGYLYVCKPILDCFNKEKN